MNKVISTIKIYTDGSCNTQFKIGGWAAILLIEDREITLQGQVSETTHNRMELLSVIKALEYITLQNLNEYKIIIYSDSQYVVKLTDRKEKLISAGFLTKKGNIIQNKDLVEMIIFYIESLNLQFVKVKAHLKKTNIRNYNRDVDKLSRKIVRECVRKNF